MAVSASSRSWKRRQARDPFVKKAKEENYRARSAYKLEEIEQSYPIFSAANVIVDIGSAPGAWAQYTVRRTRKLKKNVKIIAIDVLSMPVIANVDFVHGDFTDAQVQGLLKQALNNQPAGLILSDMAPNMSGIRSVDDARVMNLCESVAEFADECLVEGGHLVCKSFQGCYFEDFLAKVRKNYRKVRCFKPSASRPQSREVYVLGLEKNKMAEA